MAEFACIHQTRLSWYSTRSIDSRHNNDNATHRIHPGFGVNSSPGDGNYIIANNDTLIGILWHVETLNSTGNTEETFHETLEESLPVPQKDIRG